jgi:hypothetical protein
MLFARNYGNVDVFSEVATANRGRVVAVKPLGATGREFDLLEQSVVHTP